jgi:hypothetical protein
MRAAIREKKMQQHDPAQEEQLLDWSADPVVSKR